MNKKIIRFKINDHRVLLNSMRFIFKTYIELAIMEGSQK